MCVCVTDSLAILEKYIINKTNKIMFLFKSRFDGEDLVLRLPPGLTVDELRWLSVWCRAFTVNFGEVAWPEEVLDKKGAAGEVEAAAGISIEVLRDTTDTKEEEKDEDLSHSIEVVEGGCAFKGRKYGYGEEFHDGCEQVREKKTWFVIENFLKIFP